MSALETSLFTTDTVTFFVRVCTFVNMSFVYRYFFSWTVSCVVRVPRSCACLAFRVEFCFEFFGVILLTSSHLYPNCYHSCHSLDVRTSGICCPTTNPRLREVSAWTDSLHVVLKDLFVLFAKGVNWINFPESALKRVLWKRSCRFCTA